MKINPTYRVTSLLFALLIFISSTGISLSMHYCGNDLFEIAVLGKIEPCKKKEKIIRKADQSYFQKKYKPKSVFLPVFHGYESIKSKEGFGKYALYHGDLSTADNLKSALFLVDVFKKTEIQFIIAGSELPKEIKIKIQDFQHISYTKINGRQHLHKLIENAHVNTLYSFQRSGTKLKVFTALFNGRHCILNKNMIDDKQILDICEVADKEDDYRNALKDIFKKEFKLTEKRIQVLVTYNDIENAKIIVENLL